MPLLKHIVPLKFEFWLQNLSKLWLSMKLNSSCSWPALSSSSSPTQTKTITFLVLLETGSLYWWHRNRGLHWTGLLHHPPGKSPMGSQLSWSSTSSLLSDLNIKRSSVGVQNKPQGANLQETQVLLAKLLMELVVLVFCKHYLEEVPCVSRTLP